MELIEGVRIKVLRVIPDERGRLIEILRRDDEIFKQFGQVYITTAYPNVVKAWHSHKFQDDNLTVISGMAKIVLCDLRQGSPTYKKINEFFVGVYNPILIHIPRFIWHGFKCISEEECIVLNIPTNVYNYQNPDELRLPFDTTEIPYNWERRNY